ncbi:MAG: A-macroglobulin complement component [Planctomycetota bacterium]|nr:A-macroglobulin complement component [Planctomycetota bacterium]
MNDSNFTHLDDASLAALADGMLDLAARPRAEAHLAACAVCRAALGDVMAAIDTGGASAPAGLPHRVLTALPLPRGGSMLRLRPIAAVAALFLAAVGVAVWSAGRSPSTADRPDTAAYPNAVRVPADRVVPPARGPELGGTDRYLAHISSDKPLYKPGEVIFARAAVLGAFDHKPVKDAHWGRFEVRSARGEVVYEQATHVVDGVAAFHYALPEDLAGGTYVIAATVPGLGVPEAELEVDVRDYRAPRLRTDLQFLSKAYGPGDRVQATLECSRAEGGASANALATAIALLDGVEILRKDIRLDALGRAAVVFDLPKTIAEGVGTLAVRVADQGITETAAKTLPVVMQKVDLTFFPEGGELVAGLPCGVYFEARTVRKDPADIAGRILDDEGTVAATFASQHEGRGLFEFTPQAGRTYRAVLDQPAGIVAPVALPAVRAEGYALRAIDEVYTAGRPVRVVVGASVDGAATVGLFLRERELALETVSLKAGQPVVVTLAPTEAAAGVLRVTVFDAAGQPHAERLVYRKPHAGLDITVTPEAPDGVPGGRLRFTVVTKDARGRPVPAVVGLAATDDAVLSTIDPRERAARLPVQALLGSDVRELKDAHLYLGDGGAERTDLLLGTQGWRRFAFTAPDAFIAAYGQAGRRALAQAQPAVNKGGAFVDWNAAGDFVELDGMPADEGGAKPQGGEDDPVLKDERQAEDADPAEEFRKIQQRLGEVRPHGAVPPGLREPLDPAPPPPPMEPHADPAVFEGPRLRDEAGRRRLREFADGRDDGEVDNDDAFGVAGGVGVAGGGAGGFARGAAKAGLVVFHLDELREATRAAPAAGWVREFAHTVAPDRAPGQRRDFTETVYWNAGLQTDAHGRATIEFDASDAITTVRLRADGFSADGLLGSADATVEVKRAFYVEPKFPLEVSAGDRMQLPLVLVNATQEPLAVRIETEVGSGLVVEPLEGATDPVPAKGSSRRLLSVRVGQLRGAVPLRVTVDAGPYRDTVVRTIEVVPAGFPIEHAFGGVLDGTAEHTFTIPERVLVGSTTSEAAVYPTPLASMAEALEALLREPGGCFEQTSSNNYPNVMALQYMRTHTGVSPSAVAKATAMLDRGYKKLTSFECTERGYEWFGGDPGHEALTAYGVLEFHDMAQVMEIDPEMVARTRAWLLGRRDGQGGFQRNARALDSFGGAPQDITNAYIVWALLETGATGIEKEIATLKSQASDSQDSYFLALTANVLWLAGDRDGAHALMARLAKAQDAEGGVQGAATSITRSGGTSLQIETTALAALAWMRSERHVQEVEQAMRWISKRCERGRFGSTQATILALRAIVAYDALRARPKAAGSVQILLDGQPHGEVHFAAEHEGTIRLPDLAAMLTPGTHTVRLTMTGGSTMPYSFAVRYAALTPASSADTAVRVTTSLASDRATEGEPVDVKVRVVSTRSEGLPMTVAIVGLPGGLEARADQLEELVREGKVDFVETRGREVVLYWRALAPEAVHDLTLSCLAQIPGTYEGPASRTYLYYTDEAKHWVDGLTLTIAPR